MYKVGTTDDGQVDPHMDKIVEGEYFQHTQTACRRL